MLILAVDTTSRAGSLAVCRDGRVSHVHVGDPTRTHGERLPGEIATVLSEAAVTLAEIELYAVITGPGSFTGLRVGIAAVQGLALAQGRKVVPISAFDAFASAGEVAEGRIAVWRDAQRRQVFATLFERRGDRLSELLPAVSNTPAEVVTDWNRHRAAPDAFIGDGVDAYAAIIRSAWPSARLLTPAPPLAPIAAALASARPGAAVAPHAIVPIYVRESDAEMARRSRGA
jgi:tRNA threonylcarbamoyladenosine biosynthesis protein TsaB